MLEIYYLYHSGFAVMQDTKCFIFDYYIDTPRGCGLEKGVINPSEIKDKEVYVFVSHRHPDHYNRRIFSWSKEIPTIHYILSDDIMTTELACYVHGGQRIQVGDITVQTLTSTDKGVAFLIKSGTACIFHAGDLNWWHWQGEPGMDKMEKQYKRQIDLLKGETIDVAFVPVDPRLEDAYLFGLDYLMRNIPVKAAVPMHFGDDLSIFDKLKSDNRADPYRQKILTMTKRGDRLKIH